MSVAFKIPRSTRRSDYVATPGQTVFGPVSGWRAFDVLDVRVRVRAGAGLRWQTLTSGYTVALSAPGLGFATVTFDAGRDGGSHVRIEGARTHERETDVTRAGSLQTAALERELDKESVILQELRRDIGDNAADLDAHDTRLTAAEAKNVEQDGRLGAIETEQGVQNAQLVDHENRLSAAEPVIARAVRVPPGEPGVTIPPISERAARLAGYSTGGTPVAADLAVVLVPADVEFSSKLAVEAANIPASATYLRRMGYYGSGDHPPATFIKGAEPVHAGKMQSADGAWWRMKEPRPSPYHFGATGEGDDVVADTDGMHKLNAFCEAEGLVPVIPPGNFLIGDEVQCKSGLDGAGCHRSKFTYEAGGLIRIYPERKRYANFVIWAQTEPDGLSIEMDTYSGGVPTAYRGVKQTALENIHVHSASERAFNFNAAVFGAYGLGLKAFLQGINDGMGRQDDAIGFFIATENPRGTQTGHSASPAWTLIGATVYGGDKAYYQRLGTCSLISPEFADCKQWLDLNTVWGHIAGPDFEFATKASRMFNSNIVIDGGFSDTSRKDGSAWPLENAPFGGQGRVFYGVSGNSRVRFNNHRFGNHLGREEGATVAMNVVLVGSGSKVVIDLPEWHDASGGGFGDKIIVSGNNSAIRRVSRAGGVRAAFAFSRTFSSAPGATVPLYADGSGTRRLASRGGVIHTLCFLEDGSTTAFTTAHNIVVRDSTGATRSTTAANSLLAGGSGSGRRADRTFNEIRFEAGDTISVEAASPNGAAYPYTQNMILEADYD